MTCFILCPWHQSAAIYVPDEASLPVWLPLDGEPAEAPAAPSEFWADDFNAAAANDQIRFWQGGVFAEDGLWKSFAGQWYATSASPNWEDTDGDGLPDLFDQYPSDPSNNTFAWEGGNFTINGIRHMFRSDIYAGTFEDSDGNGLPDSLMSWFTNPSAHGTLQTWQGGSVIINGEWNTFGAVSYYAPAFVDQDGDGLPDEIDPFPSDVWNNTYSTWGPLTIRIDGEEQSFEESQAPGTGADTDSDGIPNTADPYPNDANNNSAWWNGGSFLVNGETVNYDGRYHRANALDSDQDGIPDDILEPTAPSGFTWPESDQTFLISDAEVLFTPQSFEGSWSDQDGDGIPDQVDPFPTDWTNGNTNPDLDNDGIDDAWETQWGLSNENPLDAILSLSGDGVTNLEKFQLGLDPSLFVTAAEYHEVTGQSWASFIAGRNALLSQLEQDWDSDGVSNVDEGNVFRTDLRDSVSKPTNSEILAAISEQKVSATTLMNFQYLVGTGGGGNTVTITVSGVPSSFTKGVAVSGSVSASGGVEPYTFSAYGLPSGVTISSTGQLSGTPTDTSSFNLSVSATDANGATGTSESSGTVEKTTLTVGASGWWSTETTTVYRLQSSSLSVTYTTSGSVTGNITLDASALGKDDEGLKEAIKIALGVTVTGIIAKQVIQNWQPISVDGPVVKDDSAITGPVGKHNIQASQYTPSIPSGYHFGMWITSPTDALIDSGSEEETLPNGDRMVISWTASSWTTLYTIIED